MTHLEMRLKQRYGITGVTSKYIKFLVMTQGERVYTHRNSDIVKIVLEGKDVYALLTVGDKDPSTKGVTTVYVKADVERIMRMEVACE